MFHRIIGVAAAAAVAALAAPVAAEVETVTKAPTKYFESGKMVGILWEGFFGRVPRHVIIQNPGYTLDLIGAVEGTLTVKCETALKSNPDKSKFLSFNNKFTVDTEGKFIWYNGYNGAVNRDCGRIVSVYARIAPGYNVVGTAVELLQNPPGYPEFQPFRISVRGDTDYGELGED